MTKNQEAYKKELKRIKAAAKRYEKQGYIFDALPQMPKRVTAKALKEIRQVRGVRTLNYAVGWIDLNNPLGVTGELLTVQEGREMQRLRRAMVRVLKAKNNKEKAHTVEEGGQYLEELIDATRNARLPEDGARVLREFLRGCIEAVTPARELAKGIQTIIKGTGREDWKEVLYSSNAPETYESAGDLLYLIHMAAEATGGETGDRLAEIVEELARNSIDAAIESWE